MKISEIILNKGRDRRKRGPRPSRDKKIGFHSRMKGILNAEKQPNLISESGNAVTGVGPIAREEILPTLQAVEKQLGINLSDVTLGSAAKNKAGGIGKKQFSGDIDATVNIEPGETESFKEKLDNSPLVIEHVRTGNTISTKIKIVNYDANRADKNGNIPEGRTGYVQLDFMPGDFDWNSFYFHSPEEGDSKYKGGYRTVLLATIASLHDVQPIGDETTEDGRPVQVERWKFSPTEGLVRIRRTLKKRKDGKGYTKAHTDEPISKPIRNGEKVMQALGLGGVDTADSFETLWNAVTANYPDHEVEEIKQAFLRTQNVAKGGVPDELM